MTARRPLLGISLQADRRFLAGNRELIEQHAEIFEVAPETLWRAGCEPGPAWRVFAELRARSGRPMVAHGLLSSIGSAERPARREQWLRALRRDQGEFGFRWYSEHLGFCAAGSLHGALPLPLPHTPEQVTAAAAGLADLRAVHPDVGFENNANYFTLGDPMDQPRLWADVCTAADAFLVLDLHNVHTECQNFGLDPGSYLEPVPWERVREIHLSGGSESDPSWFAGRTFRLDTHNGAVPEPVWKLFEQVLPRCPNLAAVIVEWVPDGMTDEAAAVYAMDFARARSALC